jgi:transposase
MRIVHRRCCGLDVHKNKIVACVMSADEAVPIEVKKREFGAHTKDLKKMRQWLQACRVTHVAMESTGVYWKPVWNILENRFELLLVNASHFHGVEGRKTDQIDSEWLAELLQCGLLKASFVPPQQIRQLRDLTRLRVKLKQEQNRYQNRIEKLLEDCNLKLGTVTSDTLGVSGRKILNAVVGGRKDPGWLADYAMGRLRNKKKELESALEGHTTEHHRWLLRELLDHWDRLESSVGRIEQEIRRRLEPHQDLVQRLDAIPGVDEITAWTLIAELGLNMHQFQTPERAASWSGLCPGNHESGGKRMNGKTRKGNKWIRGALSQVGWAVSHCKDNYLRAMFWRLAARRGKKKAAIAVAHRVLKIAFFIIRDGATYRELGGDYFDKLDPGRTQRKLVQRLEALGYEVHLKLTPPNTKTEGAQRPND